MASPQIENGFTRIANELLEAMCKVHLSANEWQVLLCIFRKTYGYGKKIDGISLTQIFQMTNISTNNLPKNIKSLEQKRIITVKRDGYSLSRYSPNKDYLNWRKGTLQTESNKRKHTKENILPNVVRDKSKPMYEEPVIELDEEGEVIPSVPKKYKDKRKLYTRLIVHYKKLTGEPAPVTRYLSAMKELVVIAEEYCDSEVEIEKEIMLRLKAASQFYAMKEWGYPTLEKLAKSWNKIPDWKKELK